MCEYAPSRLTRYAGYSITSSVRARSVSGTVRAATRNCRDRRSSNHGPIVGAPVAPHIVAPVPAESTTQTTGAVIAIAVAGSTTEAAAQMIAAKPIRSATAVITAAAGKCAGGKPGTSEKKDDGKNNYGATRH